MIPTREKTAQHFFAVASLLVSIAYASLVWQQLRYGIEYDESWNLNLVKNFAEGVGYSTTGLNYGWLVPFDPSASTGPALLVPGALFWHLSGGALWFVRIVPLLYFALYLGCLWLIFKPIAGRWAALIAVAAPLCLSVGKADISTVSLVPGRYVGEITAVTFVVFMVLLITGRSPLLAGLAGGLAVLTKFNFALPVVVIVVVWQVGLWIRGEQAQGRALLKALAGLVIPLLLFEVFRLTQLGVGGYLPNLKAYVAWLGGQASGESAPMLETLGRRLGGLTDTMAPFAVMLLFAAISILIVDGFLGNRRNIAQTTEAPPAQQVDLSPMLLLMGAGGSILVWWCLVSPEKLPRAGLPIILLTVPMLAVAVFLVLGRWIRESEGRPRVTITLVAALLGVAATGTLLQQAWIARSNDFGHRLLTEQQAGAQAIVKSGTPSIPTEWIWHLGQFQLLTGIPSDTKPGVPEPTVRVFDSIRARTDYSVDDARAFNDQCGKILYESPSVVVCR